MSSPPLSDIVAALQLLLSDLDTDSRGFVLTQAFPELVLLCKGPDAEDVAKHLRDADHTLKMAASIVDGSSGLGHLAANNAAHHIKNSGHFLIAAMRKLRMAPP